jgi:hypothetical protein
MILRIFSTRSARSRVCPKMKKCGSAVLPAPAPVKSRIHYNMGGGNLSSRIFKKIAQKFFPILGVLTIDKRVRMWYNGSDALWLSRALGSCRTIIPHAVPLCQVKNYKKIINFCLPKIKKNLIILRKI